ncbi:DUF6428 family protein [Leptospira sp. 2 VSF19]|uniref:DUF6428 family protein n=1 Tax=Leptospira soteropolitanensis TaxID=2950025 RepID=A0AAW5VTA4_9LEPT|nr:DUF6428 family protein [Leptospira soteropolitanensis]MCW7494563.1 DUF6428 family protein [Leptospira soteropolitanensis]MCW7502157.1 DUF6428 family protein [Leptospira soteropolitanensis]MCW7524413.1 DUF6428 family protein [Leptospira soteropolitanensis]MCW7528279.1 DUF6428 family protein [Leptospira soteropolitanensis]MCW7532127.1 DUF6428 family protein [Leptospira soteropolitanensis]
MNTLTWKDFQTNLDLYPEFHLHFQYGDRQTIFPNYHITEFKLAKIQSVDCGGNSDFWTEIILQVLEPTIEKNTESMTFSKVNSIIKKVMNVMEIPSNAILRIEFGNQKLAMRQYFVSEMIPMKNAVLIQLQDGKTECKASSSCGIPKDAVSFPKLEKSNTSCCSTNRTVNTNEQVGCC